MQSRLLKRRNVELLARNRLATKDGEKVFWALLLLPVVLLAMFSLSLLTSPTAHAGGSGPIIHWDSNMIYVGQNNGYPWGPVGENTTVHGANFTANINLRLVVSPGDSNSDATVCQQSLLTIVVGTATTDNTGASHKFSPGRGQRDTSTRAIVFAPCWYRITVLPAAATMGNLRCLQRVRR